MGAGPGAGQRGVGRGRDEEVGEGVAGVGVELVALQQHVGVPAPALPPLLPPRPSLPSLPPPPLLALLAVPRLLAVLGLALVLGWRLLHGVTGH